MAETLMDVIETKVNQPPSQSEILLLRRLATTQSPGTGRAILSVQELKEINFEVKEGETDEQAVDRLLKEGKLNLFVLTTSPGTNTELAPDEIESLMKADLTSGERYLLYEFFGVGKEKPSIDMANIDSATLVDEIKSSVGGRLRSNELTALLAAVATIRGASRDLANRTMTGHPEETPFEMGAIEMPPETLQILAAMDRRNVQKMLELRGQQQPRGPRSVKKRA